VIPYHLETLLVIGASIIFQDSIDEMRSVNTLLSLLVIVAAHGDHQTPIKEGPHHGLWYNTLPGDGGTQVSLI